MVKQDAAEEEEEEEEEEEGEGVGVWKKAGSGARESEQVTRHWQS